MKLKIILLAFISYLFLGIAPKSKYDVLHIGKNKYEFKQTNPFKTRLLDFPFTIFNCMHEGNYFSSFKYNSIDENSNYSSTTTDPIIDFYAIYYISKNNCISERKLDYFMDSINISLSESKFERIYLEHNLDTFEITKISFKLIYDSTVVVIPSESFSPWNFHFLNLGHVLNEKKEKPLILMNSLFYTDKKGIEYFLPCTFLVKTI